MCVFCLAFAFHHFQFSDLVKRDVGTRSVMSLHIRIHTHTYVTLPERWMNNIEQDVATHTEIVVRRMKLRPIHIICV